jgi:hypothetical protein
MPITNNGRAPSDPRWGKIWISEHGQQTMKETGASLQDMCAAAAVELALHAVSRRFMSISLLERHIARFCPDGTIVKVTAGGVSIDGRSVGYTRYSVQNALTADAFTALQGAEELS